MRAKSQEPRAKSQEPRAKSQEPRAKSQEPRAKSQEPRAKSQEPRATKERANLRDYISIARLDHATKHVFILPGVVIAWLLVAPSIYSWKSVFLGLLMAICIASANYTINEYLDREFDKHHPSKSSRAAVQKIFSPTLVYIQWIILTVVGVTASYLAGPVMLGACLLFSLQGVVYNVRPIRSKERAFFDVISESINNPIRLVIGWAMIAPYTLPPVILIVAYWLGGAFLMSAKRLSEFREICMTQGKDVLVHYRRSFAFYTDSGLVGSCLTYTILSNILIMLFLVEWHAEYILVAPALCTLFVTYSLMSVHPSSIAQRPEDLFKEPKLILASVFLIVSFVTATCVDSPILRDLISTHIVSFK